MLKAVVDVNLLSFINFAVLFSSDTDEQAQQAFDFQLIKTAGSQNCHQTGKNLHWSRSAYPRLESCDKFYPNYTHPAQAVKLKSLTLAEPAKKSFFECIKISVLTNYLQHF